jgi:hypothetical protein
MCTTFTVTHSEYFTFFLLFQNFPPSKYLQFVSMKIVLRSVFGCLFCAEHHMLQILMHNVYKLFSTSHTTRLHYKDQTINAV